MLEILSKYTCALSVTDFMKTKTLLGFLHIRFTSHNEHRVQVCSE